MMHFKRLSRLFAIEDRKVKNLSLGILIQKYWGIV